MAECKLLIEINDKEIEKTVRETVKKIGGQFELLKNKEVDYLLKIEKNITETFEKEKYAKNILNRNFVSFVNVSQSTDISRQTLHNNEILKYYIKQRCIDFEKVSQKCILADKNNQIAELKEELEQLHKRDAELIEKELEIERLKEIIREKDIKFANFAKRNGIVLN